MDRLTFNIPAGEDQRYGRDAFASAIGTPTTVRVSGGEHIPATVVAAEVAEDGSAAKVTVEMERMPNISESSQLFVGLEASR